MICSLMIWCNYPVKPLESAAFQKQREVAGGKGGGQLSEQLHLCPRFIILTQFIQVVTFICIKVIKITSWNSFNLKGCYTLPIRIFLILKYFILFSLLLLLLNRFSRVRLCATPQMAAHQALPSLGFSRQEPRGGLPFPFPMHESEK